MTEEELLLAFLIIIFGYFFTIFIGAFFIDHFLKRIRNSRIKDLKNIKNSLKEEEIGPNIDVIGAGRIIGMLERGIIFTLGLLGEYGAISFVLAAKSMARFKQLEQRQFAEYYLIGTLSSFFLALICALIIKSILNFFLFNSS